MNRDDALASIEANVENRNLIKHMLATEAIMRRWRDTLARMRRLGGLPGCSMTSM